MSGWVCTKVVEERWVGEWVHGGAGRENGLVWAGAGRWQGIVGVVPAQPADGRRPPLQGGLCGPEHPPPPALFRRQPACPSSGSMQGPPLSLGPSQEREAHGRSYPTRSLPAQPRHHR